MVCFAGLSSFAQLDNNCIRLYSHVVEFEKKIEGFENAVNDLLLEYRDVAPKYKAAFVAYWEKELV